MASRNSSSRPVAEENAILRSCPRNLSMLNPSRAFQRADLWPLCLQLVTRVGAIISHGFRQYPWLEPDSWLRLGWIGSSQMGNKR